MKNENLDSSVRILEMDYIKSTGAEKLKTGSQI